jgi:hypothetical protein
MTFTARRLNRATLARQLLLRREPISVVEAVRRVMALQAQSPPSPYLALWNRVAGFDPAELDQAYLEHTVVKASLMRITLHAVTLDDYPVFHHALVDLLRAARLNDDRYKQTGLTIDDADAVVPDALAYTAEPRTNAEMEAWLEERFGAPVARLWWAMRYFAPIVHSPTGGPWSHRARPAYVTAPMRPPTGDQTPSQQRLVWRYLEGFGPATVADIAQFTFLRRPVVRAALEGMADELEVLEGPSGTTLFDVPDGARPDEDIDVPPRLLGMWDLTLLAYADRARVLPEEYRKTVIRTNGDVLPVLLIDGHVAGVWRPLDGGIEATAFQKLPARTWRDLTAEAEALAPLLAERDPAVYRRHTHWWNDLPGAQVRVLCD